MSQDIYLKLQATKQVPAQKWVIQRTPILVDKQHIDARQPTDFTIWPDSAAGVSDTEVQKFWADASRKYRYSSEWDESWVRGSVAIGLNGGGAIDHDISVRIKRSADVTRDEVVDYLDAEIQRNSRRFPAAVGVVGLLRPLGSAGTRPGFSVVISGPHGGSEGARVFMQAFYERGISGLLARQIDQDQYGVIRGLFLPEWFCHFRDRNGGIDWTVWKTLAMSNFEKHFYEAMLVWSDEILKTLRHLEERARLNIDRISLDSYSAITFVDTDEQTALKEISRFKESRVFSAAETCARYLTGDEQLNEKPASERAKSLMSSTERVISIQSNQPMNPVELVNHRLRHPDIDYEFRPSSYWEPVADVLQTVLRNVKGTRRREMITDFFRQGRLDELAEELSSDELSDEARERLGRIHPTFMGGEYLPGYRANEVEIVRIELESTTADVISVRARLVGSKKVRIQYRVVDEYQSEFVFNPHSSNKPLTLGQLIDSLDSTKHSGGDFHFDAAWLRHGWVLVFNETNRACSDTGDSVEYRNFTSVSSEFYPDLARHYRRLIDRWVAAYALSETDDGETEK